MEGWETRAMGGMRWQLRTAAAPELERALLVPGALGAPLELRRTRRGRSFHRIASERGGLFVKRLAPGRYGATLAWRILLGRVRGRREFALARRLQDRGLPVPELLGFGERHRPLRSYESLLVYRLLPEGARTLAESGLESAPSARRRHVADALAELAARFHEQGVFHMDLTPANVLELDPGGSEAKLELIAVDLESVRFGAPDAVRLAVASLGKMAEKFRGARPAERLRFLDTYLAARPGAALERRRLFREVWAERGALLGRSRRARGAER